MFGRTSTQTLAFQIAVRNANHSAIELSQHCLEDHNLKPLNTIYTPPTLQNSYAKCCCATVGTIDSDTSLKSTSVGKCKTTRTPYNNT